MAGPSLRLCSSPPSFPPPVSPRAYSHSLLLSRRSAASRFYFVCAVARCSHLARSISLSRARRKWFTAVPERRFRRGSCACGGSTSNSFILRARSLPGPAALFATLLCSYGRFASLVASRFFFAVFLSLCIAFLTRCIMEFLFSTPARLHYHFLTVFSPSSKFRCFIMNGRIGIRPNNIRAVYHRSRK